MTNSTIAQTSDMNQLTAATYATLPFSGLRGVDCAAVAALRSCHYILSSCETMTRLESSKYYA